MFDLPRRYLVLMVGCGVIACAPPGRASVPPQTASATPAEPPGQTDQETVAAEPEPEPGFFVTVSSHCSGTWRGMLVQGDEYESQARPSAEGWDPNGFEIVEASTRAVWMRPTDSLVLTTVGGGILVVDFDGIEEGQDARVEVTPECNGVTQKYMTGTSPQAEPSTE